MATLPDKKTGLFNLKNSVFRYTPFPIAMTKQVFTDDIYNEMLENWPDTDRFRYMPNLGHKYSLSEVNNTTQFFDVIKSTPIWQKLFDEIKSERFVTGILDFLIEKNIDLGLRKKCLVTNKPSLNLWTRLKETYRGAALLGSQTKPLRSRFEFSMLPGDGGSIRPHTDAPTKYITLVVAMVKAGEWKPGYGGGTSILWPKDNARSFNHENSYLEFDEMEKLETYDFDTNQCIIFVKTFNSWHAVEPISAPSPDMLRKSLTINIESPRGW